MGEASFDAAMGGLLSALDTSVGRVGAGRAQSSAARVQELRRQQEERRFDGAASSLLDALGAVDASRPSLLEDGGSGAAKELGKSLSVFDQFALSLHSKQVDAGAFEGAQFRTPAHQAKAAPARPALPAPAVDSGLSRKANKRKEEAKKKAQAYADKNRVAKAKPSSLPASGAARRNKAKSSRQTLL
jgi:hypothetical protein